MFVLCLASLHSVIQLIAVSYLVHHRHHFALRHCQVPLIAASSIANVGAQLLMGLKMAHLIPCGVMLAGITVCFPLCLFLGQHLRAFALILTHAHQVRMQVSLMEGEEELVGQQEELTVQQRVQRNKRMTPVWHGWLLLMLAISFTTAMAIIATMLLYHHQPSRCIAVWLYAPLMLTICLLVIIGMPVMMALVWRLPVANRFRRELLISTSAIGALLSVHLLVGSIGQLPWLRTILPPWLMILTSLHLLFLLTVIRPAWHLWKAMKAETKGKETITSDIPMEKSQLMTIHECLEGEAQCQMFFQWLEDSNLAAADLMLLKAILRYERLATCNRYPQFILANEAILINDLYLAHHAIYPVGIRCEGWLREQLWTGWGEESFKPIREQIERRLAAWWYPRFLQSLDPLQKASFYLQLQ